MFLTSEQERTKRGLLKSARDHEKELQLREDFAKRKKRIELKYPQFVPNMIYIFPRNHVEDDLSSS